MVGSWPGADVHIVYSSLSTIFLVVNSNPPCGNAGGSGYSNAGECAAIGTATLWSDDDPDHDTRVTVLIPDSASASIDRGTFLAAMAIASYEAFSDSGRTKTITDRRLCAAIVDRLTFARHIIETGTTNYRLAHTTASRIR